MSCLGLLRETAPWRTVASTGAKFLIMVASLTAARAGDELIPDLRSVQRLVIVDRGDRGAWVIGTPVAVAWKQSGLMGSKVAVVISRDLGRSWREIARAPARAGMISWRARGEPGWALVRLEEVGGRTRSAARRVKFVASVREIALGRKLGVALHADGTVRIWGAQYQGGLPGSHGTGVLTRPTLTRKISNVKSIDVAGSVVLAVKNDGSVWHWGPFNVWPPGLEPIRIEGIEDALWGRVNYDMILIREGDGDVHGISFWDGGVFGDEDGIVAGDLVEVPELRDAEDIALGDGHVLVLRPDGTVQTFGKNQWGQVGDGTRDFRVRPQTVAGLDQVVAISARNAVSMALRQDGTVWTWGNVNLYDSVSMEWILSTTPIQVAGLDRIVQVEAGNLSSFALDESGVLFAWGRNSTGSLGDGTTTSRGSPVTCLQQGVRFVVSGDGPVHVLTLDGRRFAWGTNTGGELGNPDVLDWTERPVPVYSR